MPDTVHGILKSGVLDELLPEKVLLLESGVEKVVDPSGKIYAGPLAPHLTPLVLSWGPSDTKRIPLARSGTIVRLWAYADSPPTSAAATISLTSVSEYDGEDTVDTLSIPKNQQFASKSMSVLTDAGTWLGAVVTAANGASPKG